MSPNRALLTDAYCSPLRARRGAAKCGRYPAAHSAVLNWGEIEV
jgi:hypothetical protein